MPRSSVLELRIVPMYPENDVTAYIVVEDFGHLGRAFRETDVAEADPATIVRNMISGEYGDPLRTGGRLRSERMAAFNRNPWPQSSESARVAVRRRRGSIRRRSGRRRRHKLLPRGIPSNSDKR